MDTTITCSYRDCTRAPRPNWTTCGRHYTAGRTTKIDVAPNRVSRAVAERVEQVRAARFITGAR